MGTTRLNRLRELISSYHNANPNKPPQGSYVGGEFVRYEHSDDQLNVMLKLFAEMESAERDERLIEAATLVEAWDAKADIVVMPQPRASNQIVNFANESALIAAMPQETVRRWCELYPDPNYLRRETMKAFNWYEANPIKKPKKVRGWVMALSRWFERGWPSHLKTLPSNQPGISESQMTAILRGEV